MEVEVKVAFTVYHDGRYGIQAFISMVFIAFICKVSVNFLWLWVG